MRTQMLRERTFHAMGSSAHVLVLRGDGDEAADLPEGSKDGLQDLAQAEVARLEALWSRFRPGSDIWRINCAGGEPVHVAHETVETLLLATDAWRLTGGRFDPTVLEALRMAGYDRTFEEIAGGAATVTGPQVTAAPTPAGIIIDRAAGTVQVPAGLTLDLGGIGKGRAADLVAALLMRSGAAGVCVNLGGDLRTAGAAPDPEGWVIAIDNATQPGTDLTVVAVRNSAVATSARTKRAWMTPEGEKHHLIDPATGMPAAAGLAAVTAVAPSGAWAEVVAKAAFIAGRGQAITVVEALGGSAIIVDDDGEVRRAGEFERFEV